MWLATLFLGLLIQSQNYADAANILTVINTFSPSGILWNRVLINALAEKGHTLTVLMADIPINPKDIHTNIRYVHLEGILKIFENPENYTDYINLGFIEMVNGYIDYAVQNCEGSLNSSGLIEFIKDYKNEKFDLILYEYLFGPCLLGLAHIYNYPPLVAISSFPYLPVVNRFIGGHFYPGYVSYPSVILDLKNNFFDRMYNSLLYLTEEILVYYKLVPQMDKLARTVFPKDIPYLSDIQKLTTIAIVGSHPVITKAQPLPQNVIEVGGLNLIDTKPLPKDIEDFINSSKKGAVYFSLGTLINPTDIGSATAKQLLNAMENLPEYHFIWKFDVNLFKSKIPKNVLIQKFFPQRDILAHPKVKCFVTHSGGLSTQESIWFGVPMLTMPTFIDQIRNSHTVVNDGIAVTVDFLTLNGDKFYEALNEILNNPKYYDKIQLKSKEFRDRPMRPLELAIWWIEYVLRHPKADYLKVPTLEMGFLAANSYDFILLVLGSVALTMYINFKIIKLLCCRKTKNIKEKKLKQN